MNVRVRACMCVCVSGACVYVCVCVLRARERFLTPDIYRGSYSMCLRQSRVSVHSYER